MPNAAQPRKPKGVKRQEYRGSAKQRGYDTAWHHVATLVRSRDNHLCQRCLANGVLTTRKYGEHRLPVDHIVPIDMKPEWRLTPANLQTLCRRCHKLKTDEDERRTAAEWDAIIRMLGIE